MGGPWTILIEFKVPEVTWRHVGTWAGSSFVIKILPVRVSTHPYRACVFIGAKNVPHISAVIAGVVDTRAWYLLLVSIFIDEPLLAWAPVSSSGIGDGGNAVLAVLVDFDTLPIGARAWNIVLDAGVNWFY